MNSYIYLGQVRHRRFEPHVHQFEYPLFMMYLDLDELPNLFKRFWLWSYQKLNIASFNRDYYFGDKKKDLSTCVRDLVENETGERPSGPIRLLTHLRYFGYQFNPVSFFYCFDHTGEKLHSIVAEVNNTPWNEKYCYVLKPPADCRGHMQFSFKKSFHVSPFNSMDQQYDWRFSVPSDDISVHMNVFENDRKHFDATMKLERHEISSSSLARALTRFPMITGKVVFSIYYQAFRLWLKKTPFYSHPKYSPEKQEAPDTAN